MLIFAISGVILWLITKTQKTWKSNLIFGIRGVSFVAFGLRYQLKMGYRGTIMMAISKNNFKVLSNLNDIILRMSPLQRVGLDGY